jgi:CheY-like chemotaxis protein
MIFQYDMVVKDVVQVRLISPTNYFSLISDSGTRKNVLWVEDEYEILEKVKQRFDRWALNITEAVNPQKALTLFQNRSFDAIILDLKFKSEMSGLNLLSKFRKTNPDLPIFIFSAYLNQTDVNEELNILCPTGRIDKPLPDDDYQSAKNIKKIIHTSISMNKHGLKWAKLHNPLIKEKYSELKKLKPLELQKFKLSIWRKNKDFIVKTLREKKKKWCLIVGDEIMISNSNRNFPSKNTLLEISSDTDDFPLLYTIPPFVEESSWEQNNQENENDYYPTLKIRFKYNKKSLNGSFHFDTGAQITHVSDEIFEIDQTIDSIQENSRFGGYAYSSQTFNINVQDSIKNQEHKSQLPINIVLDWTNTNFNFYKNRKALIGRDILNHIPAKIVLDSFNKTSSILLKNQKRKPIK